MGLVLPALSESLLPERTPADAARVLTARHAGITVALLLLAPIIAARLDGAIRQAQEREVAIMLDARIDPLSKVQLVGQLASGVGRDAPRRDLQRSFASFESASRSRPGASRSAGSRSAPTRSSSPPSATRSGRRS